MFGTVEVAVACAQVSYMILQRVSPVTHSIGNCLKRVIVIVASVVFFQNPMGRQNQIGAAPFAPHDCWAALPQVRLCACMLTHTERSFAEPRAAALGGTIGGSMNGRRCSREGSAANLPAHAMATPGLGCVHSGRSRLF